MDERERIEALRREGKINDEEAQMLLEALEAADQLEGEVQSSAEPKGVEYGSLEGQAGAGGGWAYPSQERRWVKVNMLAGQLEVRVDPSLQEPRVWGKASVRQVGQDLVVEPQPVQGDFLGGVLKNFRAGELDVRLPPGWGLELDGKAGDIEIEGVAFVRGRLLAGDIELREVGGLDLDVKAGNIEGSALLREGSHRLRIEMGNAQVRLLPGSSLKLKAGVGLGNLETPGDRIADGVGTLEAYVRMGNLEIEG
ncbi:MULTISPECIES: hypothetical protein [unclassified Meiothermus]|uniref:hypothetical protein n=1 Tax=unclassified Meiothermus TaxID=370471 RepID=UPI000D7C5D46|nr:MULTISPECIES: hypothetical protein [unclassified Meiothermus]PZA06706.1 hypothetical protein DNA98_11985 [Meiothermus sp. Pnk-1]RYM36632.1 hypothetical protein EWH23_08995 [Meiothermus sp. PNK-Is4]